MRRAAVVLVMGLAVFGVSVPTASAGVVRSDCAFGTVSQQVVTGSDLYTGAAYGHAMFDDQGTHSLRCYVTVYGTEQASTPTGTGTLAVTTVGSVTFAAPDGADVALCTEIDGVTVSCSGVSLLTGSLDRSCSAVAGLAVCAGYTPGTTYQTFSVQGPSFSSVRVAAYVDLYQFILPNGGTVAVPCVVVNGGSLTNACRLAGGSFLSRLATLIDKTVRLPTGTFGPPWVTVDVCNADFFVTVDGIGVTSFPAYALC
jgi:hypothetical protein